MLGLEPTISVSGGCCDGLTVNFIFVGAKQSEQIGRILRLFGECLLWAAF
jgi:hypothetical protein